MGLGVAATINQAIDPGDLVVEEMGHRIKFVSEDVLEEQLETSLVIEGETSARAPVVTVVGRVDHGKTSLLDYIRNARVTSEKPVASPSISVPTCATKDGQIAFIDTPGRGFYVHASPRCQGHRYRDSCGTRR